MRPDSMKRNRPRSLLTAPALLITAVLLAFLSGGCEKKGSRDLESTHKEDTTMAGAVAQLKENLTIPPIDASAPARVETATFALG